MNWMKVNAVICLTVVLVFAGVMVFSASVAAQPDDDDVLGKREAPGRGGASPGLGRGPARGLDDDVLGKRLRYQMDDPWDKQLRWRRGDDRWDWWLPDHYWQPYYFHGGGWRWPSYSFRFYYEPYPYDRRYDPPRRDPDRAYVDMGDDYFSPRNITVRPGTLIIWTNLGDRRHTVTSDWGRHFDSRDLRPGETFRWRVPDRAAPGTRYFYHCRYHARPGDGRGFGTGMVGSVTVTGPPRGY